MKDKFKNLKHYAKKYGISVLTDEGKHKSVNELAIDIYEYELGNDVVDGLYPFLHISKLVNKRKKKKEE
jgi:hypothetical protein